MGDKKKSSWWKKLNQFFSVNDTIMDETFSLGAREPVEIPDNKHEHEEKKNQFRTPKKLQRGNKNNDPGSGFKVKKEQRGAEDWKVTNKLSQNLKRVKEIFNIPLNKDFVVREFYIALDKPVKAFIIYIDGAVNSKLVDDDVLQPLMLLANLNDEFKDKKPFDIVHDSLTPTNQVTPTNKFKEMVTGVLNGDTAVFVDGSDQVLVLETKGWPGRSVSDPKNEQTVRGPQEAFVENIRTNTGLVRKRLRTESLITEMFSIGKYSNTTVAVMYIKGIVNPKLVREVKRRLKSIKIDYAAESGIIEQYLDDNPMSFVPTVLATERPDRVAAFMCEGHVTVIVDGSTFALIMPTTFWAQLHTPEDYYLKWPFGSFLRVLRFTAFFLAMLTPAVYIAITNYHPEMIPTDLLFSIAATREQVPFPVVLEVLLMEVSFELIREAGIRIPGVIGPTIGIVGALILGQAAVAASIVSPILVIVVAITGLASSALPNYSFNLSLRLIRFAFIFIAAVFGFVGIATLLFILNIHTMGQKSLGVPMGSPVAPFRPPAHDQVILPENYRFNQMPSFLRTMKKWRQAKYNRVWDPRVQKIMGKEKSLQDILNKEKDEDNNGQD